VRFTTDKEAFMAKSTSTPAPSPNAAPQQHQVDQLDMKSRAHSSSQASALEQPDAIIGAYSDGAKSARDWLEDRQVQANMKSIVAWRATCYMLAVQRYEQTEQLADLITAWEEGWAAAIGAPNKVVGAARVPSGLTAASSLDGHPQNPAAMHLPFSWLDASLDNDPKAQFVALTMDVCRGAETCLQLLHSDMLTRNANQWADPGQEVAPILEKHHGEHLLLLATAATRMLSNQAEERIEMMNERVRTTNVGGAA
jgi:hypothetical protein